MPLEVCPGRLIWERHRNREYLVFVDESFYRFFGFCAIDGNFCHGALGIPRDNYDQLKAVLQPLLRDYTRRVHQAIGQQPAEIKYSVLRTLPLSFRLRFARELVRALVETGGFVSAFYSSTRGTIMERVRTSLLERVDAVPDEHAALFTAAKTELLVQFQGVGQAELITHLLLTPFSSFSSLLRSFDCTFRVCYDPRQSDEDRQVRDEIADYMGRLVRVPDLFGNDTGYLGVEINTRSHDEIGLQLADVIAGEVREFFRSNPDALIESATLRLITPESDEPLQKFIEINNRTFKNGALSPMSNGLFRRLARRNSANIVSYYYPVLSAGMLTCVTDTGQLRDLEISTRLISDLLD
jgi:hypothetical protein